MILVDTPGFDDGSTTDTVILKKIEHHKVHTTSVVSRSPRLNLTDMGKPPSLLESPTYLISGKGVWMVQYHYTAQSAHDVIQVITMNHPVVPRTQRGQGLADEHKDITDTAAGEVIYWGHNEWARRNRSELEKLKKVKEGMMQALKEKDDAGMDGKGQEGLGEGSRELCRGEGGDESQNDGEGAGSEGEPPSRG